MGGSVSYEQHHGSYIYQIPIIGTQTFNHSCGQEGILEVKNVGTTTEINLIQTKEPMIDN